MKAMKQPLCEAMHDRVYERVFNILAWDVEERVEGRLLENFESVRRIFHSLRNHFLWGIS